MATTNYGFKNDFAELVKVSARDMNRRANILDTQLPGALSALGAGVVENETKTSLQVIKDGLDYYVSAGEAIVETDGEGAPSHPVRGELPAPTTISGANGYIHVALRVAENTGDTDTEEGTASLDVVTSTSEELPGALLLAQIVNGAIVDRREFCRPDKALRQILGILSDIGYDAAARVKGSVKARLDKLETPLDAGNPGAGVTPQQFAALVELVGEQKARIDALEAAKAEEGAFDLMPPNYDLLWDQVMINATGLAEVNPPSVERGQVSVITATAGRGQNDSPDYSPDTGNEGQLVFDPATGTFGGDV